MITPSQIKEKVLSTASHGYDIDETNAFLQQIEESFPLFMTRIKNFTERWRSLPLK